MRSAVSWIIACVAFARGRDDLVCPKATGEGCGGADETTCPHALSYKPPAAGSPGDDCVYCSCVWQSAWLSGRKACVVGTECASRAEAAGLPGLPADAAQKERKAPGETDDDDDDDDDADDAATTSRALDWGWLREDLVDAGRFKVEMGLVALWICTVVLFIWCVRRCNRSTRELGYHVVGAHGISMDFDETADEFAGEDVFEDRAPYTDAVRDETRAAGRAAGRSVFSALPGFAERSKFSAGGDVEMGPRSRSSSRASSPVPAPKRD